MNESALAPGADEGNAASFLDRTIDISVVRWGTLAWVLVIVAGFALRFARLDVWALSPSEGHNSYAAFALFRGSPMGLGERLPTTGPLLLLLQAFSFFLFGVTDITARIMPALLGFGLVLLPLWLRPFIGRAATLGMAALVAISPTLIYSSRTADPQIALAFCALLFVTAFLRTGLPDRSEISHQRWGAVAGLALAGMLAADPSSISVLIAIVAGAICAILVDLERNGAVRRALGVFITEPRVALAFVLTFAVALIAFFTRMFSDLGAIRGIGTTFADWAKLVASGSTTTPAQFFLLAILLYEPLAIVFGLVSLKRDPLGGVNRQPWPFFAGWFATALLLFSFSSRRAPEHAVLVALPLVLLGGAGIGNLLAALDWRDLVHGRGGMLFVAAIGLFIGLSAFLVLAGRISSAPNEGQALFQAGVVAVLVVGPLVAAIISLVRGERAEGRTRQIGYVVMTAVALLVGAYTFRSSVLLNFYNADQGIELLAQNTPTAAVQPLVQGLRNLSRDATVTQSSVRDVTGGHGLKIALDQRREWPFRWYFRDFPDLTVVAAGQAPASGADVVFAPDSTGMAEAGYTPTQYPYLNRVPTAYADPEPSTILSDIFGPSNWKSGVKYLLFRDIQTPAVPDVVNVGLNASLAARVLPNSGPYNLFDRPGAGNGRGQFSQPRDAAVDPDTGDIYVVDMGNARVERFDANGKFVGIFGGSESGSVTFARTQNNLGPTGVAIGPDQLIYVCDTWNHRIVVLDADGKVVREFGTFGDVGNNPASVHNLPGQFFGPRAVEVYNNEIYVVDTGNERVQVFAKDGTFKRSWGGKGSGPNQLTEPVGIAISNGRVYIADSGNGRISVFDTNGTPIMQWKVDAWQGHSFFEPYLAFGGDGNLYATSSATGSVEVYTPNGQFVRSITQINGQNLQQPIGIAAEKDGSLLVTDAAQSAVFRYVPPPAAPQIASPAASPAASPVASPAASPSASPAGSPEAALPDTAS